MSQGGKKEVAGISEKAEKEYLEKTLAIVRDNVENYSKEVARMGADIDEMLAHYHDNDAEVYTILSNTITLHDHMKHALVRNAKAAVKPYFGRIVFHDESLDKEESIYIGKGGISKDATHWMVVDWRAPVANVYYENGLGKCSYSAPEGKQIAIDLELKRTYEIEDGRLLDFFDTEVVANDDLLTKYLAKNKQAVLSEIIATIQKEQNDIIRKSPYHNVIVQGVAGSGKTTVAMHRISFILYNYQERFKPDDFYIVGSNRILLNYITGVLPDLDVYGIRQMTMKQLFVRLLDEDWDEKKYQILSSDKMTARGSIKGTLRWFHDLEAYCRELEWKVIPRKSVYLNPKQFLEGIRDGKTVVFDETIGKLINPNDLKTMMSDETIERYIRQNPTVSVQSKINMLNDRLMTKVKDEFLGKGVSYTESERKAIRKAYRGVFGKKVWQKSIFEIYREFLDAQFVKGYDVNVSDTAFDVYDLAALAYLYKRIKETEVISEAHHVVIDEAQDFGMMAYCVLKFCIKDCTYTIMGDISQNIHFGYGLNDWEELKTLLLTNETDSFGVLKKSYRNTVEISEFATNILHHGQFSIYPVEPIIRHGSAVQVSEIKDREILWRNAAKVCQNWQEKGLDTIAVICRNAENARTAAVELGKYISVIESDLEKAVFGSGIMVLPVEYTKGLEFDAVLILDPTREEYPVDDGHAKLLYVAATRALHELCVLHSGDLTGLIADPLPERVPEKILEKTQEKTLPLSQAQDRTVNPERKKISISHPSATKEVPASPVERQKPVSVTKPAEKKGPEILFGDMPTTEILRPAGHSKIDLAVRWVMKQPDGLYLQSRYGVLRLSPVGSAIIRITFAKGQQPASAANSKIAVRHTDSMWMYKESSQSVELVTDELILQVDKGTGSIRYLTRDKKLLLAERGKESRQIETGLDGRNKSWLFLDWQKNENIFGMGAQGESGINLRGTARYISHEKHTGELPFLLSDHGYGILIAADGPTMCCNIAAYGSYLYTENETQMDYYFIAGKSQNTIMKAYAYLCEKS